MISELSMQILGNRISFTIGCIAMLMVSFAQSQTLPEFNMSDTTVTVCEGILFDSGGPDDTYGNDEFTTFVINTGGIITLTFFDQICLENNLDFISIYDGPDDTYPLLGSYTGNTLPPVLVVNGGVVTLVLTSDDNVAYCGFSMEWETEQPIPIPPEIIVDPLPACNDELIQLNFSYPIGCWWWDDAEITVTSNGNEVIVTNTVLACLQDSAEYVLLVLEEPITQNCPYEISVNIGIPDDCELIYYFTISTSFDMFACPVNATVFANPDEICPGACSDVSVQVNGCYNYTYSWNNGLPATSGPHTVCPDVTTVYSVTVTEIESGNSITESITVEVSPTSIITPDFTTCQSGDAVDLQAESNNGTWYGDGIVDDVIGLFEPDSASSGVNVIYYESGGCLDSMYITINPIATDNIVAACPGSPDFQLNASPTGGVWTGPSVTSGGIFTPAFVGIFNLQYEINGCTDDLVVNVEDISGTFSLDTLCQSEAPFNIDFSPLGGVWSGPGITDTLTGEFTPAESTPGDIILLYEVEGCDQEFTGFIKEIYIDGYHTSCPGEDPLIWNEFPIPAGGYWSGDGIVDTNTGLFDPSLIPNDFNTSIIYYAPNGCSDTTYIYNLQTVIQLDSAEFCLSDDILVLNYDNVGNAPDSGGEWTGAGITEPWDDHWEFNPASAGEGVHTLIYEKNNCSDSMVVVVYPDQLNAPSFSFCQTENALVLVPDVQEGGSWTGNGITDGAIGMFDPTVSVPGNFFVYWNAPAGCSDSVSVFVEEFLQASISGLPGVLCYADSMFTFQAEPPGGIITGANSDFTFNPAQAGEGSHEIIYTYSGVECESTDTITVLVYEQITTSIEATDDQICLGESVIISVIAEGGDPTAQLQYEWSNGALGINTITVSPTASETFYVITFDLCSDPVLDSVHVEVLPEMEVEVTTSDTLCFGELGFAMATVLNLSDFEVQWNNVVGESIEANSGTVHELIITDLVDGCQFDSTVAIPAYSPLTANFSINPNEDCIAFDDAENISLIDLSVNALQGTWIIGGEEFEYEPGNNPSVTTAQIGQSAIELYVFNEGNCPDTAFGSICILPPTPIFIPDIFSPNNDGHNDMLFVRGQGVVSMEFLLYSRWGEKVFTSNSIDQGWDGVHRGKPSPDGVYMYFFRALLNDGTETELKGDITLIR